MNMFGGDDPFDGHGAAGLFAQLAQGFPGGFGPNRRSARSYDEYMKAYSVALLPGNERTNLSYGGKIIMPPSALANLTNLDLESPWMFKLSNPANPAASTHAGVLEFIAEEGCVHLPYWMMKTLNLNEGDPIRITGAELPKGQFVKLQPQAVHFLEISDPKAVLEHALRNFSALTQGDIIAISYNSIVFDFLVMESQPGGEGINIIDTDLEVDFAPPVGYKEPERPKAAPPPTMASKLKIDLGESSPGSSRPPSSLSGAFAGTSTGETTLSKGGEVWESFKGKGETLNGRKTKGRGISQRGIENLQEGSKVFRTDKRRIVTNDTLDTDTYTPAALNLPHGKLFFGFKHIPYNVPDDHTVVNGSGPSTSTSIGGETSSFSGSGNTLSGRTLGNSSTPSANAKGKGKEKEEEDERSSDQNQQPNLNNTHGWGRGQTLSSAASRRLADDGPVGAGGARVPRPSARSVNKQVVEREPSPEMDWGVDSDEEPIYVDSD
ncbi:UFD1-domain-containing protein [Fomitiporia mediterranea MF3/22]|uniref:UFD1-domain-containing protein n=1 Tax=Fomitiporia mediterranea (strain MF3/22) TaxID=694068 RepID=UPI0004408B92|nr:UFD1-domain-containing protein [Fomitiporia mediterranea MF3/22]EJD02407.1 UFD1-domain-containing protein [Fomitiporia mediterranea MF3/22]